MSEKLYRIHHGWVQDLAADPSLRGRSRLELRMEGSGLVQFSLDADSKPIRLEDEISVVVDQARPKDALIVVNHTTGQGINLLRSSERRWPSDVDMLVIAAVAGLLAATLEYAAIPAVVVFAFGHWVVTRWYPRQHREKSSAGIDYLLDKDYCRWRARLDRQRGEP